MAPRIKIVEDEEKIARVLQLELEYEGYEVSIDYDGLHAWENIQEETFDLYILDVMLPGLSGMELLRRIRREKQTEPVLMLTARDATVDKVTGLDQGADDYMTKPFDMEELLARIRVLLRRGGAAAGQEEALTFGALTLNVPRREAFRGEDLLDLTPREFDLLHCFLEHPNHVLSREQLLDQVWGFAYAGETNVVDVYVRYLRQKMDKPYEAAYIRTVRGVGYVLKEPVS
ncbi:response regulator transcription factor [Alkalicoccus urumqiensis]|uniref:DNA-binding response regulator n=1 Tax=Alkalicoccus urumqiensis TaxID=1548213 RepID=A0A2P6MI41_ALKUR|nr:response regulator transcription factor [Alkalicoccus urumqiensis]PRO65959.1 DNA-binding response regulator [Alkalicoccus urumqiensis]